MTPRALRSGRGVTLVELMVALAVAAVVLAALFSVVQGQQTAFFEGHLQRGAQGSARSALSFLEQRLTLAGYGMDAPLAFDFDRYPALPCPPQAAGCPRDSIDGNDELVFHSRDPRYWVPDRYVPSFPGATDAEPRGNSWRIVAFDPAANAVTVNARAGDRFVRGRIVQAVCKAGARYAYFTVAQNVTKAAPDGPLAIPLLASVPSDPFRRQAGATDACFAGGQARLFLIDRYRFHVRTVASAGGFQPYLVLDTGLDADQDGPDEDDEVVIAEGIETFQVGYVMTSATLAARGTIPNTLITFAQGPTGAVGGNGLTTLQFPGAVQPGQGEYRPTSWYGYGLGPPPHATRLTDHQANIRGVRISIGARGSEPDPGVNARAEPFSPILNLASPPAWVAPNVPFNRARVETTVMLRNMTARSMTDF